MVTLRLILACIWFFASCVAGFFMSLFRWGDLNLVRDIGRLMAKGILPLSRIRIELQGAENLDSKHQPCVYVGNHQSAFDVPVYGSICPQKTVAVGKRELNWVPLFNLAWIASGNISIDRMNRRKAMSSLQHAAKIVREKNASVVIFPEGTRNRGEESFLPFKKGAFHLAIAAQIPVVPIVVSSFRPLFDGKKRRFGPGVVQIKVLAPVPTAGLGRDDVESLLQKVRQQMLEAHATLQTRVGRSS